jgi:hypothetical protein
VAKRVYKDPGKVFCDVCLSEMGKYKFPRHLTSAIHLRHVEAIRLRQEAVEKIVPQSVERDYELRQSDAAFSMFLHSFNTRTLKGVERLLYEDFKKDNYV